MKLEQIDLPSVGLAPSGTLGLDVKRAIAAAQQYLFSIQSPEGYWCGELEGDTILESEYILTLYFLGFRNDSRLQKAASYIRSKALREGGWAIYPGGPPEVSASVKAYFVLKLLGDAQEAPHMSDARHKILELGGIEAVNSFTKIYLAIFQQYPWNLCPAVPPEIILLPIWFPLNIYEMSSWSRGIIVPLSVIWAAKPKCPVPDHANLPELWSGKRSERHDAARAKGGFWLALFEALDRFVKSLERRHWLPWRKKALKESERWMIEHFKNSDGIGAIFPPIVNSLFALRALGYSADDRLVQSQIRELEKLQIEEEETLRLVPCFPPVWDTALAVTALTQSGLPAEQPQILKAARWILSKEVKKEGDWKKKNPHGRPGGWYFEFANEFYPDIDDTFQVLIAMNGVRFPETKDENNKREAVSRALSWLYTMQNKNGGWGSFDRDSEKEFLTKIPFADHNAMIDPSTSDITARGVEALISTSFSVNQPPIEKALAFLSREQEKDGTWFGRWGCNYLYGTWLAVRAFHSAGRVPPMRDRIVEWLSFAQNQDGGWGELPNSYDDPHFKAKGPSTPSQTAWALMTLMNLSGHDFAIDSGAEYLLEQQREDGHWVDDFWSGTGFPKVFYLRYHLYATYFSLMALSLYRKYLKELE